LVEHLRSLPSGGRSAILGVRPPNEPQRAAPRKLSDSSTSGNVNFSVVRSHLLDIVPIFCVSNCQPSSKCNAAGFESLPSLSALPRSKALRLRHLQFANSFSEPVTEMAPDRRKEFWTQLVRTAAGGGSFAEGIWGSSESEMRTAARVRPSEGRATIFGGVSRSGELDNDHGLTRARVRSRHGLHLTRCLRATGVRCLVWLRARHYSHHDAEDIVQGFFTNLLRHDSL